MSNSKPVLGYSNYRGLPYWIDDQIKLTESKAILKYIATTRGAHLLPKTPQLQAVADMVDGFAYDRQEAFAFPIHGDDPYPPPEEVLSAKLKLFDSFFSGRKWVVGEDLTYMDFYVYQVLKQFAKFSLTFLTPYPSLEKYLSRFEALPEMTEYVKSIEGLSCYSSSCKVDF